MTFFVWLILGVVIGHRGSLIMRSDPDRGAVLSVVAGIGGRSLRGGFWRRSSAVPRDRAFSASARFSCPCWGPSSWSAW